MGGLNSTMPLFTRVGIFTFAVLLSSPRRSTSARDEAPAERSRAGRGRPDHVSRPLPGYNRPDWLAATRSCSIMS